ncbi:MAG: invasin domain 3-containing protein [Chitinophagaceae bacterium]
MKYFLPSLALLCLAIISNQSIAQCNVNDKYDKIISGYHSSIALKDNGVYAVWGSYMKAAGNADQLSPQDISSTNYSALTGTIYKAALGGKNAGSQVDQAFVLTSDGLWAWGVAGNVVSTGVKSGNAFGRTSTTSANGFNTYGLPSTVAPTDVATLFATYQTLVILTTTGNVWMLTQTTLAVEGAGGTATSAGTSKWVQVKINSTTNLTGVTAVRGQVSSGTYNAFMALTTTGQVYTWGNSSYLGDNNASAARNYATLMTLPSEFSSSIPKMIGVTGGISTTTTTKNTYYILSAAGNLYALGDNTQRQCGDFTTTERKSWVRVQKSATASDYLTNINFFSCQEHDASYPAVAAINTAGVLYTWGNNSSGMVGRTDDGTMTGTLSTVSFDPGTPVGFTGKAVSVEMGGHTMVYLKEGSSQFCYVGHYTNGSMGDGTSNNNGSPAATSLKHDCTSTPAISICGSVPTAGNTVTSTIVASLNSITADGASISVITIRLKDGSGTNLTSSGGVVTVTTNAGTLGTVTDNNDGTYTVNLTSSTYSSTATINFAINGSAASSSAQVSFTGGTLPLTWVSVTAYRDNGKVTIQWETGNEVNVKGFDIERSEDGINWVDAITNIPAANGDGNHSYKQTDTASNSIKLYYRIRQVDIDGKYTYSPVRTVAPVAGMEKITIYPVPASSNFHLGTSMPGEIKHVELFSITGNLLRVWNKYEPSYNIQDLPSGTYMVRVHTSAAIQVLKLNK